MAYDAHKNLAYSTIATAPSPAASGGSLVVFAGDGTKFPAASFNAIVWPANTQPTTSNAEIVRVTVIATDTFTVTRAQEGTAARTIIIGDQIAASITAKTITDIEAGTTSLTSPTIQTSIVTPASAGLGFGVCQGRLTLTSGTPVTTADVTGATTIYFTPYLGNNIGLYDGSTNWTILPFAEISVALGTLTSGLPYDIFCYNNSGTVALRSPVAWTSTTARATALVLQNGVWVKTGATTDRYLGTFYTSSTTTTADAVLTRYLWNYYNRARRHLRVTDATAGWAYTIATYQQANASTANQVQGVVGVAESLLDLSVNHMAGGNAGAVTVNTAIGEDSTTTADSLFIGGGSVTAGTGGYAGAGSLSGRLTKYPAVGYHKWVWLEKSQASGTTNWGSASASGPVGLSGWIEG